MPQKKLMYLIALKNLHTVKACMWTFGLRDLKIVILIYLTSLTLNDDNLNEIIVSDLCQSTGEYRKHAGEKFGFYISLSLRSEHNVLASTAF